MNQLGTPLSGGAASSFFTVHARTRCLPGVDRSINAAKRVATESRAIVRAQTKPKGE